MRLDDQGRQLEPIVYCRVIQADNGIPEGSIGYLMNGIVRFPRSSFSGSCTKTYIDSSPEYFQKIQEVQLYEVI